MNIHIERLPSSDMYLIEPQVYEDDRGFFMETLHQKKFIELGIHHTFVQENRAGSRQRVLRGLHYQIKHAQGKLVQVLFGEVFDVAVDLRRNSPMFGKPVCVRLAPECRCMLWIPPGFAHGYYVLSDWAEVAYKATDFYAPEWERTLLWNDPQLGIEWPLLENGAPILSAKDAQGKLLAECDTYEEFEKISV